MSTSDHTTRPVLSQAATKLQAGPRSQVKRSRPSRLPELFSPCTVSSYVDDDQAVVVKFTFPPNCPDSAQWATGIVEAGQVLGNLFSQFARQLERTERTQRAETVNKHWQARQRQIQQAYVELRQAGVLHRAAIRSLMVDPRFEDLRSKYRWDSAVFSATVRATLGPSPLRIVPTATTKGRRSVEEPAL